MTDTPYGSPFPPATTDPTPPSAADTATSPASSSSDSAPSSSTPAPDPTPAPSSSVDVPERDADVARADEAAAAPSIGAGDLVVQRYDDPYDDVEVVRVGIVAAVSDDNASALVAFLPAPHVVALGTLERA